MVQEAVLEEVWVCLAVCSALTLHLSGKGNDISRIQERTRLERGGARGEEGGGGKRGDLQMSC